TARRSMGKATNSSGQNHHFLRGPDRNACAVRVPQPPPRGWQAITSSPKRQWFRFQPWALAKRAARHYALGAWTTQLSGAISPSKTLTAPYGFTARSSAQELRQRRFRE